MSVRCGIRLGTTCSAISYYDVNSQRVGMVDLEHADGGQVIPSVVYVGADGNVVVGEAARNAAVQHPDRVIVDIMRRMSADFRTLPIDGREYTPHEVLAEILKVLRADAETYLDEPVTDVVISVPTCLDVQQRRAMREAARLAGLNVLDLVLEPLAVLQAFALDRFGDVENQNLVVYDLGHSTFELALVTTERGNRRREMMGEILATEGDQQLGGQDWTRTLARIVADKAMNGHSIEAPHLDGKMEATLLENCEAAKCQLSRTSSLSVPVDLQGHAVEVSRSEFERETNDLVLQAETLLESVLEEAERSHGLLTEKRVQELESQGMSRAELEDKKVRLLLCGGATRMPMIQDSVTRVMGEPPLRHESPESLVTMGAAYWAHLIQKPASVVLTKKREEPAPPSVRRQLTATHVIDMFAGLNLPVTDDEDRIEAKGKELGTLYLRRKNSPDPQQRDRAQVWFRNLTALKTRRDELLDVVREYFTQLADAALEAALSSGIRELSQALYDQLVRLAMTQCQCDQALAQAFVDSYLEERGLKTGHPVLRPEYEDVVHARFAQLADAALERALSSGTEELSPAVYDQLKQLAVTHYACDPSLGQAFVHDYLTKRGDRISYSLLQAGQERVRFLPKYEQIRIQLDYDAVREAVRPVEERLDRLEKSVSQLADVTGTLSDKFDGLGDKVLDLDDRVDSLGQDVSQLEQAVNELKDIEQLLAETVQISQPMDFDKPLLMVYGSVEQMLLEAEPGSPSAQHFRMLLAQTAEDLKRSGIYPTVEVDYVHESSFQTVDKVSVSRIPGHMDLSELRDKIVECFNEDELRLLCSDLGVGYDQLPGGDKAGTERKVLELILYFKRRGRIRELLAAVKHRRPNTFLTGRFRGFPPKGPPQYLDQDLHIAIGVIPGQQPGENGKIVLVYRTGFRTDQAVLRYAEVVIKRYEEADQVA